MMNIQARKYSLIEYLIELKDESLITKIESLISSEQDHETAPKYKPLTKNDLVLRANEANEDYISGRVKTQEQLESDSENW